MISDRWGVKLPEVPVSIVRMLLILAVTLPLGGCTAALWGNLAVLAVTVGIFIGTLSLGRASGEATRSGDRPDPAAASQS
jgi:hypothetical protein